MNSILESLEEQVKSVKELLDVFRQERQSYVAKQRVGMRELAEFIDRKKRILVAFDQQRDVMARLKQTVSSPDDASTHRKRILVRELASVIEQLLVIDQENEKLLKTLLAHRGTLATGSGERTVPVVRPALTPRMPFFPGNRTEKRAARPVPETVVANPSQPVVASVVSPPPVAPPPVSGVRPSRSRLKDYLGVRRPEFPVVSACPVA
jgi:flagellar biosynthesis/type III secretory pathway chaperone